MGNEESGKAFAELCDVMDRLRGPGGCPWDRVQTLESLKPYLLEETYEVLDAMDSRNVGAHREELGDLLFQVVFHSRIRSEEQPGFNAGDVCHAIRDKLVRRHPHVFGQDAGKPEKTSEQVLQNWEQLKRKERDGASVLTGVPPSLPALARAQRVGAKAAHVGFDWPDLKGVMDKVREEMAELEAAVESGNAEHVKAELGDLLFSLAQFARFSKINAEDALREQIARFSRRFQHMESSLKADGKTPEMCSMEQLEALWQAAKRAEKEGRLTA